MGVDFKAELSKQLGFLTRSCASFDEGHFDEAIRIAVVLRVLFHETPKSISLLSRLDARDIRLLSTTLDFSRFPPGGMLLFNGMGDFSNDPVRPYQPKLGDSRFCRQVPAIVWWAEIVFAMEDNIKVARRDVVLEAANKHGGAHVDAKLTPTYELLIESHGLGSFVSEDGTLVPISGHHYVALRQMGYEVLNSPEVLNIVERD